MNMDQHDSQPIGLYIGIDWADKENVYEMQVAGSSERTTGSVKQRPEVLSEWLMQLKKKIPAGSTIAVALEQSRGALIYFLQQFDFVLLYPINPKSLAKFREAFRPSGCKDDPGDTSFLLDMLLHFRDRLRPWLPDDVQTRKLSAMCELRRKAVNQRTRLINAMTSYLKFYFPQALNWAGHLASPMACDFLVKWPTLHAIKRARPETVCKFYHSHHSRNSKLIEKRLAEIQSAVPITSDPAIVEPYSMAVSNNARLVAELTRMIDGYQQQIDLLFAEHPDHDVFALLPGAGPVMAPRLLSAIGTDRNRYESASEIQQYSGVAPVTKRSGNTKTISWRKARPKFMCQSWLEFASHSVGFSVWANAFYHYQRSLKKGRYAALRALAYKWIRIIFRCWKLNEPYNEQKYLDALRKHNSPLLALLKNP